MIVNSEQFKTTTIAPSTTTTTHRSVSTDKPLYRLDRSNGQACILLQVDAIVAVKYRTKYGDDQVRSMYKLNSAMRRRNILTSNIINSVVNGVKS